MTLQAQQALTDAAYWDSAWQNHGARQPGQLSTHHPYYGPRGIFCSMVRAQLGSLKGLRVLELGGGGKNYRLLALRRWEGAHVTAVDFSDESLTRLRDSFARHQEPIEIVRDDIFNYRPKQLFDVVVHWGLIEHFENPEDILALTKRLLKHRGQTLFTTPNMEGLAANFWRRWAPDNWTKHILHDGDTMAAACQQTGFTMQNHFYFGYPAVKIPAWERGGIVPRLLSLTQNALKASSFIYPWYHRTGSRWTSLERGVTATL